MRELHSAAWNAGYLSALRAPDGTLPDPPRNLDRLDLMDWIDGRESAVEEIEAHRLRTAAWHDRMWARYARATEAADVAQAGTRD